MLLQTSANSNQNVNDFCIKQQEAFYPNVEKTMF